MKSIIVKVNIILIILIVFMMTSVILTSLQVIQNGYEVIMPLFVLTLVEVLLFFIMLHYISDLWQKNIIHFIKIYVIVTVGLYILMKLYELVSSSIFIYSFSYQAVYLILIIYPVLIYGFMVLHTRTTRDTQGVFISALVGSFTVVIVFIHAFFLLLGGKSITPVHFSEQDVDLVLVENTFIFSSEHQLYLQKNALFVTSLQSEGYWSCDDGCPVRTPEAYDWQWVDDHTLVISYDWFVGENDVIYYFEWE